MGFVRHLRVFVNLATRATPVLLYTVLENWNHLDFDRMASGKSHSRNASTSTQKNAGEDDSVLGAIVDVRSMIRIEPALGLT